MPNGGYVGVSKRMQTEEIRAEWRKIGSELCQGERRINHSDCFRRFNKENVEKEIYFCKLWQDVWREGKILNHLL
ncbi:hypothetical protein KHA80_17175 [Anaerobacillus sp. HL2]|nr:hypothetical protein KHA80_17175 [Anaerobacillus sp. HL2]